MKPIITYLRSPIQIIYGLAQHGFLNWLPDKRYIKLLFKMHCGYELNLKDPKTFNEKLQWLKLYDRKTEYTNMVDKYAVKKIVGEKIGQEYLVPTLGIWSSYDDIDFSALPKQFVLKCTHDSGGVIICRDKDRLNFEEVKTKIKKSLKRNYYYNSREWPYKNVTPQIMAEQYLQDGSTLNLNVYKIFNFYGEPKIIQTIQNDKQPDETIDYFDINWKLVEMQQNFPNSLSPLTRPKQLEEMLDLARKLSRDFPFLRTDFYVVNDRIYFSEFTFYSDSGMASFHPFEWDIKLGEWIKLP